jgi:site-specific recombinase XerD
MSDDYEAYERDCETIRAENSALLEEFTAWLKASGLAPKTINKHLQNIEFYVNDFLLHEDATPAADGAGHVGMFLGYWFIRKAMWASQSSLKENAASLKKFYRFMQERGDIDQEDLDDLNEQIKEGLPDWLATLQRYDDPSIEDPAEIWR